mmetsp:Transcript_65020/g.155281  ORF Transcript_65020/g.155281 Transcript_65020/m.155281 type:complete len:121 (-) Transcript_65020:36-398(-)
MKRALPSLSSGLNVLDTHGYPRQMTGNWVTVRFSLKELGNLRVLGVADIAPEPEVHPSVSDKVDGGEEPLEFDPEPNGKFYNHGGALGQREQSKTELSLGEEATHDQNEDGEFQSIIELQ